MIIIRIKKAFTLNGDEIEKRDGIYSYNTQKYHNKVLVQVVMQYSSSHCVILGSGNEEVG